jgi:hypothetical protein
VVLSRAFRLNLITMFLTTNLNNPIFAPLLVYGELQIGGLLRNGTFYHHTLEAARQLRLLGFAADLFIGSIIVGVTAGLVLGLSALCLAERTSRDRERSFLIEGTALRYFDVGYFHWEYTRAVLQFNPLHVDLVRSRILPREGTIYHVRCGFGILLVLQDVYVRLTAVRTAEPHEATASATPVLRGVDDRKRMVRAARTALGSEQAVEVADPAEFTFTEPGSIVLFDVLRRSAGDRWKPILMRAVSALGQNGVLVIYERAPRFLARWRRPAVTAQQIVEMTASAGLEASIMTSILTRPRHRFLLIARRTDAQESS